MQNSDFDVYSGLSSLLYFKKVSVSKEKRRGHSFVENNLMSCVCFTFLQNLILFICSIRGILAAIDVFSDHVLVGVSFIISCLL